MSYFSSIYCVYKIYRTNRKSFECKLCGKPHYARDYCKKHYLSFISGRQLEPSLCSVCKIHHVRVHIKEGKCALCYTKEYQATHRIYKKDGGKWGYKSYKLYRKLKKKRCEICNSRENLDQHHKDKNKRNPDPKNLITVCTKCHMNLYHPIPKNKNSYFLLEKKYNTSAYYIKRWLKNHSSLEGFKEEKSTKFIKLLGKTIKQIASENGCSYSKAMNMAHSECKKKNLTF